MIIPLVEMWAVIECNTNETVSIQTQENNTKHKDNHIAISKKLQYLIPSQESFLTP